MSSTAIRVGGTH